MVTVCQSCMTSQNACLIEEPTVWCGVYAPDFEYSNNARAVPAGFSNDSSDWNNFSFHERMPLPFVRAPSANTTTGPPQRFCARVAISLRLGEDTGAVGNCRAPARLNAPNRQCWTGVPSTLGNTNVGENFIPRTNTSTKLWKFTKTSVPCVASNFLASPVFGG